MIEDNHFQSHLFRASRNNFEKSHWFFGVVAMSSWNSLVFTQERLTAVNHPLMGRVMPVLPSSSELSTISLSMETMIVFLKAGLATVPKSI